MLTVGFGCEDCMVFSGCVGCVEEVLVVGEASSVEGVVFSETV